MVDFDMNDGMTPSERYAVIKEEMAKRARSQKAWAKFCATHTHEQIEAFQRTVEQRRDLRLLLADIDVSGLGGAK